jgi:hypothetical protein
LGSTERGKLSHWRILRLVLSKVPSRMSPSSHLKEEKDPVSETSSFLVGRLCVLLVGALDYRSRGPDLIPGATRLSEK